MFASALLAAVDSYGDEGVSYSYSTSTSLDPTTALIIFLPVIVLTLVLIIAQWRIFTKAGQPGWASVVPIYNYYVMLQIVGRPAWWLLLMLVPFVNFVVMVIIALDLAKAFGKSEAFGIVGLILFAPIGYMMLGFGGATYHGSSTTAPAGSTPPPVAPPAV